MKHTVLISFCIVASFKIFSQTSTVVGSGAGGGAGAYNSSFGYDAGKAITASGVSNTFIGERSGYSTTSGVNNTFIGGSSGFNSLGAWNNTFLGSSSGYYNTASDNTFVGQHSGSGNTTGTFNTFIGENSGDFNRGGSKNVTLGANSYYYGGGDQNVVIGEEAGYHLTGSGNVFIGYQAGYGNDANGSNKLYIANSSTPIPLIYGDFSTKQLGINALPSTCTLNVGGTINATDVMVNGVSVGGDASYWTKAGSNVTTNNNIGVGTTLANNPNGYMFAVNGKIGAKEVQIENTSSTWPDFVFKPEFKLRSLRDVENFIKDNGHLPEIPSEKQVKEEGIKVGEMNAKLLQKIEELTLYVIEANKRINSLTKEVNELQSKKQ
jgi:hypothetical protein